jgi:hypothetical protein
MRDDLLRRIDGTLHRLDETLERNTQAFDRNTEVFTDFRVFTRDLVTRQERFMQTLLAEFRAELAPQRRALFAILDRLPPLPEPNGT